MRGLNIGRLYSTVVTVYTWYIPVAGRRVVGDLAGVGLVMSPVPWVGTWASPEH